MIMMDQSKRLSEPLRWGRRERTAIAAVLACALLALVGFGVYALTSGAPARAGCIEATFPSTLGVAELHECGAKARVTCASASADKSIGETLLRSCRKAGYPLAVKG
jgi:hypothetical protein